ncbi:MAG: lipid-A-disaccharide synthase [Opitutus sp.]
MTKRIIDQFAGPEVGPVDLLVIAGEHSGDEHAARMIRQFRRRHPTSVIVALGGPALKRAGAQLLFDLTASSVVGIFEVLKNYAFFKQLFEETLRWIAVHQPRAVCFVDYPGMNLRLAAALREQKLSVKGGGRIKTLFYISPQIWAWKAGRRFKMARTLDALAVIFPFEVKCYADTSLAVEFVRHPFIEPDYAEPVAYDPAGPILLLPGSRKQAVERIFPELIRGFQLFGEREAVVLYPSDDILQVLRAANPPSNVRLLRIDDSGSTTEPFKASAVLTSSGTMSMHCALSGIPGAIVYRANPLTYMIGRMLVKIEYLGIANLLLNEPMYPEFIQQDATPAALADQLRLSIHDAARHERTADQSRRLRRMLSQPGTNSAGDWLSRNTRAGTH